ncbi:MAG: stalk domain-containing protein [Clostridia bacterium]
MKKFILGLLTGAMIFGTIAFAATFTAKTATFKVTVDDMPFKSKQPVVVINGSTYMPLKAVGEAVGADVSWNAKTKTVEIYSPTLG